jgi:WD40 repeat protein
MPENNIWYVRLDVCIPLDLIGIGNNEGKVLLYSISKEKDVKELHYPSTDDTPPPPAAASIPPSTGTSNRDRRPVHDDRPIRQSLRRPNVALAPSKAKSLIRQVSFHPEGKYVLNCSDNGTIAIWSIKAI